MAYPASRRVSYLGQLGVMMGFTGAGILIGVVASMIPLLGKIDLAGLGTGSRDIMEKLLVPENANALRISQFLSTLFIFFLPAIIYARVCHKKSFTHLGYRKPVSLLQALVVILIMLSSLPLVGVLGQLTEMMPFSEETMAMFRRAEDEYLRQVEIIGRMNNFGDFLVSLFMLAILPAVFEETLFRGGLQNLLARWWKLPVLAIIISSLIFSFIHFSYIGFLSRFVLGFILGWFYHRTGNLWLSIIGHVTNNAVAISALYIIKLRNPGKSLQDAGPEFPLYTGAIGLVVVISLLYLFDRVSKDQVDRPGREVPIANEEDSASSWLNQNRNTN